MVTLFRAVRRYRARASSGSPMLIALFVALPGLAPHALAHHPVGAGELDGGWNFEPWLVSCLAASALLYARGVMRLWSKAGTGRGIQRRQAACFAAAWIVLTGALVSPLDAIADRQFWLHMIQHELLMVVAAPLFVVSRPLEAIAWGLPASWRVPVARGVQRRPMAALSAVLAMPSTGWLLHALVLWGWHAPRWFDAALHDTALHVLQHASFFATALLFWWTVLDRHRRHGARADGVALASLFTTMLHTGALGALLTFSPTVWYPTYRTAAPMFGLTALEDQQLGGLVMWIPAGLVYVGVALAIASAWLRRGDRTPRMTAGTYGVEIDFDRRLR